MRRLVQNVIAAFGKTLTCSSRIKLGKFGLETFVDKQKGPDRAAQVTAAAFHDFVDCRVA